MKKIKRSELGDYLSAMMPTCTVKSDFLSGTVFDEWAITGDWLVSHLRIDNDVLIIECVPREYWD